MAFFDRTAVEEARRPESETVSVTVPSTPQDEDKYINTRGATLNYTVWRKAREVYCADKNSPGDL